MLVFNLKVVRSIQREPKGYENDATPPRRHAIFRKLDSLSARAGKRRHSATPAANPQADKSQMKAWHTSRCTTTTPGLYNPCFHICNPPSAT